MLTTQVKIFFKSTLRLSRLKDSRWWLLPSVALSIALSFVFGILNTMSLSEAAKSQIIFGSQTTSINLNDLVRPTDTRSLEKFKEHVLVGLTTSSPCTQIGGVINSPGSKKIFMQFSELSGNCSFKNFGYTLTGGRWPLRPNEVVVSANLPFKVGSNIRGASPTEMTVVGKATNANETYSTALLASSGTWDSWNMTVNDIKFPQLQSSYSLYFSTKNLDEVRDRLYSLASDSPQAASVQLSDVSDPNSTLIDRFPFLYKWLVWPLAFLGVFFSLLLRRRQLKVTRQRMVENGMSSAVVESAVISSNLIWLAVLFPIAGCLGWLSVGLLSPLAPIITGHTPGINYFPFKTILVFEQALSISYLLVLAANLKLRRGNMARPEKSPLKRHRSNWAKKLLLVIGSSIFVAYFPFAKTVNDLFALLFIMLFLVSIFTPELTSLLARGMKTTRLSTTYAKQRISNPGSKSWMTLAASVIAFGPFVAVSVLISSSVAFSLENQKLPPRPGQAIFYPSGESTLDKKIGLILTSASLGDSEITPVFSPLDSSGSGVVASDTGLGAIGSIRSSSDLGKVLGRRIPSIAETTLKSGGVVWIRPGLGENIWLVQPNGAKALSINGSTYLPTGKYWSNDTAGFISTATAEKLGLSNNLSLYTANKVSAKMQKTVPHMLVKAGLDSNFIRFFRPVTTVNIAPFQLAVGAILGFIGIALLLISLRGSLGQLVLTSRNLTLQGVPKRWFGSVYALEAGLLTVVGLVLGTLLPLGLLYFGSQKLGISLVIPFSILGDYILLITAVYILVLFLGLRRLLKNSAA
jgi:hypothetical protein